MVAGSLTAKLPAFYQFFMRRNGGWKVPVENKSVMWHNFRAINLWYDEVPQADRMIAVAACY
jgi:hypothetical protein